MSYITTFFSSELVRQKYTTAHYGVTDTAILGTYSNASLVPNSIMVLNKDLENGNIPKYDNETIEGFKIGTHIKSIRYFENEIFYCTFEIYSNCVLSTNFIQNNVAKFDFEISPFNQKIQAQCCLQKLCKPNEYY
jgi:regulator of RNase E activity RraB